MDNKLNTNKVLFNKLNDYFKDNIRISLINDEILIIITKEDLFYCIDIKNENIRSFIINDDNSVDLMIIEDFIMLLWVLSLCSTPFLNLLNIFYMYIICLF